MHKVTFYPVGNADCCQIDCSNGQKMLFDFAHYSLSENKNDPRIDLEKTLREDLTNSNRDYYDVVGFTHADDDHVHGAGDFFFLNHASKYQSDSRIKIKELWVPAAMIIEDGLDDDARILRQEARYRLKKGEGIRVFSRPDKLKDWLKSQGIDIKDREHLISDAGKLIPTYSLYNDNIEFFVHSPFAAHVDSGLEDRNLASLILQVTFQDGNQKTRFLLIGDTDYDVLSDIVKVTKQHNREEYLSWDIYDIPHHCSYKALNEEKGKDKTDPVEEIKWLLSQGNYGGYLISSSKPIPSDDKESQPPHRQAANCYKEYAKNINGEFKVTMEFPNTTKPKPIVIEIDWRGARLKKDILSAGISITSSPAKRAG